MGVGSVLVKSPFSLEWLEKRPVKVISAIGVIFALAYLSAALIFPRGHGRIVNGDAIQYYAYLRSLAIDHDVDFTNEYAVLYARVEVSGDLRAAGAPGSSVRGEGAPGSNEDNVWLTGKTATGRPANMMSIGPALLWTPFFMTTYLVLLLLHPLGNSTALDGFSTPFLVSAGLAGVVYATLGAYFCYRSCRLLFDNRSAFWGTMAAWLATPAVYYSVVSPAYSHAPSVFAVAMFCYVWLATRDRHDILRYIALGVAAGLAAVVRWQDIIILLLPALELIQSVVGRKRPLLSTIACAAVMVAASGIVLLPQLLAWRAIYGELLVMPQGGGFMRWTEPAVASVLFSLRHGLFSWTPAVLVAVWGLVSLVRRDPLLGWASLTVLCIAIYVNASVNDWWAGAAFGARRFVSYTVFFALGLAAVCSRPFWLNRPSLLRACTAALIVYNLLFVLQYQMFMRGFDELVPYPTTPRQVFFDRLVLPWHLIRAWLNGT